MNEHYILVDKKIQEATLTEWGEWLGRKDNPKKIERTEFDDCYVSTVFLGLDHSFTPGAEPVLFETMVFGGDMDQEQDRCCTYDQAVEMHKRMCEKVRKL